MENTTIIFEEVSLLSKIRQCYNHYLASEKSIKDIENAAYIKSNRRIINISINKLHAEADKITRNKQPPAKGYPRIIHHVYTEQEDRAIMDFNSDKRYRYRE